MPKDSALVTNQPYSQLAHANRSRKHCRQRGCKAQKRISGAIRFKLHLRDCLLCAGVGRASRATRMQPAHNAPGIAPRSAFAGSFGQIQTSRRYIVTKRTRMQSLVRSPFRRIGFFMHKLAKNIRITHKSVCFSIELRA